MDDLLENMTRCSTQHDIIRLLKDIFFHFRMYTVVHARMVKVWLQVNLIFRFTKYKKMEERGKNIIHGFFREVRPSRLYMNTIFLMIYLFRRSESTRKLTFARPRTTIHFATC